MKRLLRVPVVLVFAALWGLGAYWLGYGLLDERLSVALGVAFAGGVAVTGLLGSLSSRPWPILAGLPLAVTALVTSAYAGAIHHYESRPRLTLVVAGQHCTREHVDAVAGTVCDARAYTFTDGRYHLDGRSQPEQVPAEGASVQVYRVSSDEVRWWPAAIVQPRAGVELAARITVPLFVTYTFVLALGGALGDLATRRRFRRHMLS